MIFYFRAQVMFNLKSLYEIDLKLYMQRDHFSICCHLQRFLNIHGKLLSHYIRILAPIPPPQKKIQKNTKQPPPKKNNNKQTKQKRLIVFLL